MLDWDLVKDDKELIKQVEKLVEDVCEIYFDFPEDVREQLNKLTGNSWSGENYIEYCAEFWSSSTLEETIYALFHDGDYPDIKEREFRILRPLEQVALSTLEICHALVTNKYGEAFNQKFEDLPADEIVNWFCAYFQTWEKKDYTNEDKISYTFIYQGELEYGYERFVGVSISKDKTGFVWSKYMTEEDWNAVLAYFDNAGGYFLGER